MTLKGYPSQGKDERLKSEYVTVVPVSEKRFALDVNAVVSYAALGSGLVIVSVNSQSFGSSTKVIGLEITGHGLRRGDLVRFVTGLSVGREVRVWEVTDANNIIISEDITTDLPVATDTVDTFRPRQAQVSTSGSQLLTYTRNGVDQVVTEDTGTPANNRPLPVKLTGITGDVVINAPNVNLAVQLDHDSANPDSVQVGDGTEILLINTDGSVSVQGQVADNAADAGNPVKVGGRYNAAAPTYADGDRGDLQLDANGRLLTTTSLSSAVAANAPDTENPIKVGARYDAALPTYTDGDKTNLQSEINGRLLSSAVVSSLVPSEDPDTENPIKVGARYDAALPTYTTGDKSNLQSDANGRLLVAPSSQVASEAPDTENPFKVGGRYDAALPTYTDGDKTNLQTDVNGRLLSSSVVSSLVAANAPDTENPIKTGARYDAALPTYTDGDKTNLQADIAGRLLVAPSSQVASEAPDTENPFKVGGRYDAVLPTYTTGDKTNLQTDVNGRLLVATVATTLVPAADPDTENPQKVGARYDAALPTYTDGDKTNLQADVNGRLHTTSVVSSLVPSEDPDTENPIKVGARYDAVLPTYTTGDKTNLQTDINGRLLVSTPAATALTPAADPDTENPQKVGARYDAALPTYTDGDKTNLQSDINGKIHVTDAETIALNAKIGTHDLDTGGGTENRQGVNLRISANGGSIEAKGQQVAASSIPVVLASDALLPSISGRNYVGSTRNDYTSVNVTTGAWVELVASMAALVNYIDIFDSSGQTLELGFGAAAAEARQLLITPGGNGPVPLRIPAGTRVSIRAVSALADVGELDINYLS